MIDPLSIQDFAKAQIETTKKVYLLSPERMFSEYNGEKENIKNYNGRQLLEMLQNADDAAYEHNGKKKALIKLEGKTLIIANTGAAFSEEGLKSIFHSHLSPKQAKENQIGKKGLGFRSILSWSDKVTIKSHDLCVAFSQEYSQKVLTDLLIDEKFKSEFHKLNKTGNKTPISTLVCPDIEIAEICYFDGIDDYDTIIEIDLHEQSIAEVKKQIENDLDGEVLLFLNNLEKIEIDINGELSGFKKNVLSENVIKIQNYRGEDTIIRLWNVNTLSGRFKDIDSPYQLTIAWQDDFEHTKDVIYSYFRTKVPIKCKGILHGSFELNADRNLIIDDENGYNKRLLGLLPQLIADTAEIIATKEVQEVNYKAVNFLHIDFKSLNHLINTDTLKTELYDIAKNKNIFPTISNIYISWGNDTKPVYYEEKEFSAYLSPKKFRNLLKYCDDKNDEILLKKNSPYHYKIESIIDDIAQRKEQLSVQEYAQLIHVIHKYAKNDILSKSLFYDNDKNLLGFEKTIFLPNKGKSFVLPSKFGGQIIHSELAEELLNITQSDSFSSLCSKYSNYKIKEYKFSEVVEILIKNYALSTTTVDDIIELHKYLYNIYASEENIGKTWVGTPVLIINKKKEIVPAKQLYFGKDYNNSLLEDIFSYDKGKIVAEANKFNIDAISENDWKKYLEWLGVESFPKIIKVNSGNEFAEYAMKKFDYKLQINDRYFKGGYEEFKKELTGGYGNISVTSIDDIDKILANNTSEKIIQLIEKFDFLFKSLEKGTEPDTSFIELWFYNAKNHRTIHGNKIKSYLKWKIEHTHWLNTEGKETCSPIKCCTAAYINEDFRGLVEKPKLDYDELKRRNINRDKVDYLLSITGVHKAINTFPTAMLYSIFLNLPRIDESGKKAKTIYNQLVANFDEKLLEKLDKTDTNYVDFHQNGKVLCKNGTYIPVKEVYYVNDKRYGETIIKQFNTIEIDRRRGKDKIKQLFGIEPLDNIKLDLIDAPVFHPLNSFFESEMERFKPYVYVFRKEVDGGSEKNTIKDLKFKLVTELNLNLSKDNKVESLNLNEYEYFYLKSRATVFIRISNIIKNIQNLKDDIPFCTAIAESFTTILDVDSQRQQIRELFSKPDNSRDELLRAELEDNNLQKLNEARNVLGITNNPKLEFWKSFALCLNTKGLSFNNESSDEVLLNLLTDKYSKLSDTISEIFNAINYEEINEETSASLIVKLFNQSDITINRFNQFHYPTFDIKELYNIEFKRAISRNKGSFKSIYYERCLDEDGLKLTFNKVITDYDYIKPNTSNEVGFDVEQDLGNQLGVKYQVDITKNIQPLNLELLYENNLELLRQSIEPCVYDKKLVSQFLDEDNSAHSLLFFEDKLEDVEIRFKKWVGEKNFDNQDELRPLLKSKRVAFGTKTMLYDDYRDLKSQIDNVLESEGLKNISSSIIEISKTNLLESNSSNGLRGSKKNIRSKISKEDIGFISEYIVYRFLLENSIDKESVKWVSAYAKESGVNLDGKDGLGYDIEYIPKGAIHPRYVEVKTVSWDNSFHISANEVRCGEKYNKNYEIFLVRNIDTPTNAKIERIRSMFDYKGKSSFTNNDLFTVINDNYILKFNKCS
jgi:Domain of unknown function (DUF3883)